MSSTIAIDPHAAKPHAFATFINGQCYGVGDATFHDLDTIMQGDVFYDCVIEDQYMHMNVKTLISLTRATGEIVGLCKQRGIRWHFCNPAKWQRLYKLYGLKTSKEKRYRYIEAAGQFAKGKLTQDQAVAVLMGAAFDQDTGLFKWEAVEKTPTPDGVNKLFDGIAAG